ncbi:unnamed protein product [Adineta ricciae]|uniref:SGNH hydrolase-type esterase domain-containing protein n=1 Tax=Adineta ricciae TaxID=249248 RepID=A0A814VST9_ADIRI|nr:unnamed protein product [Adineta ricciae]
MAGNQQQRTPISILAIGDSLTEGYYKYGRAFHPYAKHLTELFDHANIPVNIQQKGVSGERVVPTMINRLRRLLSNGTSYDWIIILGGTNDLADSSKNADIIFQQGLQPMYELCLNHAQKKTKLVAMTVIENTYYSPQRAEDKDRQNLNNMIRNYVANSGEKDRIILVDLDKGIPYHSVTSEKEREEIYDDVVHLTPVGYDRMATLIFDAIKDKL